VVKITRPDNTIAKKLSDLVKPYREGRNEALEKFSE
jgi:hypothetical protein